MLQVCFQFPGAAKYFGALLLLFRSVDGDIGFVGVVEESENSIVLFLRQRIEFMIMALRALDGYAEDSLSDRVHPVVHGFHAELLGIDAALLIDHGIPQVARGHHLVLGGIGEQVAGNLFDDELVVRQIAVEGMDHPVAIEPHEPGRVFLISVGIGVSRRIQPDTRPTLAVMRTPGVDPPGSHKHSGCDPRERRRVRRV